MAFVDQSIWDDVSLFSDDTLRLVSISIFLPCGGCVRKTILRVKWWGLNMFEKLDAWFFGAALISRATREQVNFSQRK